jgi:hypothetical protein
MKSRVEIVPLSQSSVLVVGVARNCEKHLLNSVAGIQGAFVSAKVVTFLVIESDSTDKTVEILRRLSSECKSFDFVSLGHLRGQFPLRTERIAFCRNYYLKLIDETPEYRNADYVVIADFDGVNVRLSSRSVSSCWLRSDWDVCTANQYGRYYDIWALRHPLWSPNDCWEQANFLFNSGTRRYQSVFASVISRMIVLDQNSAWVEVESAFGGLAIYRKAALQSVRYNGLTPSGEEICEHVSLHFQIRRNGGRIFVNPMLINSSLGIHINYVSGLGLLLFRLRCQFLDMFSMAGRLYLDKARAASRSLLSRLFS